MADSVSIDHCDLHSFSSFQIIILFQSFQIPLSSFVAAARSLLLLSNRPCSTTHPLGSEHGSTLYSIQHSIFGMHVVGVVHCTALHPHSAFMIRGEVALCTTGFCNLLRAGYSILDDISKLMDGIWIAARLFFDAAIDFFKWQLK